MSPSRSFKFALRGEDPEVSLYDLIQEVHPPGWGGSVKAMKGTGGTLKKKHRDEPGHSPKKKEKRVSNPYALAWWMKKKGYKPHYKEVKHTAEDEGLDEGSRSWRRLHKKASKETAVGGRPSKSTMASMDRKQAKAQLPPAKVWTPSGYKWPQNADTDEHANVVENATQRLIARCKERDGKLVRNPISGKMSCQKEDLDTGKGAAAHVAAMHTKHGPQHPKTRRAKRHFSKIVQYDVDDARKKVASGRPFRIAAGLESPTSLAVTEGTRTKPRAKHPWESREVPRSLALLEGAREDWEKYHRASRKSGFRTSHVGHTARREKGKTVISKPVTRRTLTPGEPLLGTGQRRSSKAAQKHGRKIGGPAEVEHATKTRKSNRPWRAGLRRKYRSLETPAERVKAYTKPRPEIAGPSKKLPESLYQPVSLIMVESVFKAGRPSAHLTRLRKQRGSETGAKAYRLQRAREMKGPPVVKGGTSTRPGWEKRAQAGASWEKRQSKKRPSRYHAHGTEIKASDVPAVRRVDQAMKRWRGI